MLDDLLAHVPVSTRAKEAVVVRLSEPHRHYHDLRHVLEMWAWHKQYCDGRFNPQMIASFCLYHDAVYYPDAKDNEARSAELWKQDSIDVPYNLSQMTQIAIEASANHFQKPQWLCVRWCLDLDLLRLGAPESEFTQHGIAIRAEFCHVNDVDWIRISAEWRTKVLAQPSIFSFPQFAAFETTARRNLARALVLDWTAMGYLNDEPQSIPI